MQNIEFKAELRNIEAARQQCALLGARHVADLKQTDTYFKLTTGRLKKRETVGRPTEWIVYDRRDVVFPRLSSYSILTEKQARMRWGTMSLKPWLTVVKHRELWMLNYVRVHLDAVDRLGTFIEFEAKVSKRHDARQCRMAVDHLREAFGPVLGEPISASYCDLMDQLALDQAG
jgi:adenylate cyclase class IV